MSLLLRPLGMFHVGNTDHGLNPSCRFESSCSGNATTTTPKQTGLPQLSVSPNTSPKRRGFNLFTHFFYHASFPSCSYRWFELKTNQSTIFVTFDVPVCAVTQNRTGTVTEWRVSWQSWSTWKTQRMPQVTKDAWCAFYELKYFVLS